MKKKSLLSPKSKRYIISSIITFGTAFLTVILANIDHVTVSSLSDGVFAGVVFTAVRAGAKALIEYALGATGDK